MPVDFYRIMKIIFCCPAFLLILSCCDRPEAAFDPRSVQYNDRAVEMMQSFIREGTLDTTGFSDAVTLADSSRIMFGSIVDSCQALLDSAVMYSPDYYLYYAQKAFFYAYCADYERSYRWISEALARKDIPEIRLYAGMLLHKMGKHGQSQMEYGRAIGQYEMRDTLSEADLCNYAFALSLAGEKEKALQVVGDHIKDSVMKKQMSEMIGEGGKVIGTMIP